MMEQEEAAQDSGEAAASKDAMREAFMTTRRDKLKHISIVLLALGFLFTFAPTYLQANIDWITNTNVFVSAGSFAIGALCLVNAYPGLLNSMAVKIIAALFGAAFLYALSENIVDAHRNLDIIMKLRAVSFLLILMVVLTVTIRLPHIVDVYKQNKDKIRALSTFKNIFTAIGAAVVFLTGLFQLMQVVLQILHH